MADGTSAVERFLFELDHPLKGEIEALRALILGADPKITEHIKWNAPSFCYAGDDRITMRLHPPDRVELVFHRGVKVKDATGFSFDDPAGLLRWPAKDRAVATFRSMAEIELDRPALVDIVRRWMQTTSSA